MLSKYCENVISGSKAAFITSLINLAGRDHIDTSQANLLKYALMTSKCQAFLHLTLVEVIRDQINTQVITFN